MFTLGRSLAIAVLLTAGMTLSLVACPSHAAAADAVLIDFSSPQCGPCVAMQPVIGQLERSGVPVRHVNVMSEPHLAKRFGIRSTPTYVVLVAGKEVTRLSGTQTLAELREALAVSPSGPLIQTGSDWKPQRPETSTAATAAQPQTQLAMLTNLSNHPAAANAPTGLGQSGSEPMPSTTMADAVQRAEAATVRLRVFDGTGFGAGTGTIVDTHGDEALVLTCGHLFRETKGDGRIEVDLFVAGEVETVQGQLIDYDAEDRDIALVAIRPGFPVQPVPMIQAGQKVRTGQVAFSFGCDRGDPPTRRDTRVTGVDKYNQHLGVSNIEISGAPIDGRSGGGLFDDQGRLIGVCNAADYKEDLGIYAGPGSVHWQLEKVNLTHLIDRAPAPAETPRLASLPTEPNPVVQASVSQPTSAVSPSSMGSPASAVGGNAFGGKEVIVIIRDRDNPNGPAQVRTITQPSAAFINMIGRQGT
tara:strand:- start:7825 stop:9240 length:1416 start_codon:yes stop_codon:yes gene_type:complete